MATIVARDKFTYPVEAGWGSLPNGWDFGDGGGVAVDAQDNVYVFNRGANPTVVFDRAGNFLRSWGEGSFVRPHAVQFAPDGYLYCAHDTGHTIRKYTTDCKLLLEIGTPGELAARFSGRPFNGCIHTALSPTGDVYVTEGYSNARVHKLSQDGKLVSSWSGPGTGPREFDVLHNICCDRNGWVYIADRENRHVQVFDANGRYETEWHDLARACSLHLEKRSRQAVFCVGELGPMMEVDRDIPNIGPQLNILSGDGKLLALIAGAHAGSVDGDFTVPHAVAADSRGDVYVGEVSYTSWPAVFPRTPAPARICSLQRFARVDATAAAGGAR